ncbi:MAG: hypothetical protein KME03_19730 [Aphanocapsa lilacina HA4352-LM1]|nr:hypothetical protein [Aphanocapsa lilacina HA4352-LM1]
MTDLLVHGLVLADHGNVFNHIAEGRFDEILTTPLDWFILAMMVIFAALGAAMIVRWARRRPSNR